jgi:hypothetical protein
MHAVQREDSEGEVVDREDGGVKRAHWGALILLAGAAAAAPIATTRLGVSGFVIAYSIAAAAWLVVRRVVAPLRIAILIAVALRIIFTFAEPRLSGDVYRYLWDGNELAHARNPYARAPLGDSRINHPEIPTIYPPHAEILFAIAHQLPLWRLLLIGCDLTTLVLLPRRFAFAYATFPPLLFEGAWSAHVEIVAAMLLLIALTRDSGSALGGAIGVKVIPIAALPALLRRSSKRWRFVITGAVVLIVPVIPFAIAGPLMPGMRDYAMRWVFNSPAYDAAFAIVDRIPLKAWFTAIKDPLHLEAISHWVYYHVYSDFVTRGLLALLALALIIRSRRVSASVASLLLSSPAIHPWYWIVAVPAALIERADLVIAFALCAPFSYLLYGGVSKWIVYALCYVLPIALLRLSAIASSAAARTPAATRSRTERDTSRT